MCSYKGFMDPPTFKSKVYTIYYDGSLDQKVDNTQNSPVDNIALTTRMK